MLNARLYFLQRLSALVMAPLVIGHLAMMIYAVQNGLTGEEILSRTRGNLLWAAFYATFVLAVSIHASIGVRVIFYEVFKFQEAKLRALTVFIFMMLCALGLFSVYAVTTA